MPLGVRLVHSRGRHRPGTGVCLVESLTGSPTDAALNQRLEGAVIVNLAENAARLAARLRADVEGDDAAHPVVVATSCLVRATIISVDDDIE